MDPNSVVIATHHCVLSFSDPQLAIHWLKALMHVITTNQFLAWVGHTHPKILENAVKLSTACIGTSV